MKIFQIDFVIIQNLIIQDGHHVTPATPATLNGHVTRSDTPGMVSQRSSHLKGSNVNNIKSKAQIGCHSECSVQTHSAHADTFQTMNRHATSKFLLLLILILAPPPLPLSPSFTSSSSSLLLLLILPHSSPKHTSHFPSPSSFSLLLRRRLSLNIKHVVRMLSKLQYNFYLNSHFVHVSNEV